MFGDNESALNSLLISYAKLHKCHVALSFHCICQLVASKFVRFYFLPNADSPADILSKHWSYASNWENLQCLLFWKGDPATMDKV